MPKTSQHINDSVLAAMSVKTNGPRLDIHDIVNFQIVILNPVTLEQDFSIPSFAIDMKPLKPDNVIYSDYKTAYCTDEVFKRNCKIGLPIDAAIDQFCSWYKRLKCDKITPIVYNWSETRNFVESMFLWNDNSNYFYEFFTNQARDIFSTIITTHDLYFYKTGKNSKLKLATSADTFIKMHGLDPVSSENSTADAQNTGKIYKYIMDLLVEEGL